MTLTRAACVAALLAGVLALPGACGPRPTEAPPIQRGTALPPPGLEAPPR